MKSYSEHFYRSVMKWLAMVLFISCPPHLASAESERIRAPVIVDTDMGIDDWLALAYITQNPRFELLGITIAGNGLAPCPEAAINAQYLLDLTGTKAPVACSSPWPMNGFASYPRLWREQSITMLGENPPVRNQRQPFEDAPRLLVRLLENAKQPVEVIALGAMTNVAIVLQTYPDLKAKIKKITSMGGAVGIPGNLRVHGFTENHPNTKAEWNYYIDPVAANLVFVSGVSILLVPLNATNQLPLTKNFIERIRLARESPIQAFIERTLDRLASSISTGEYYHWDPLAAAVASDPTLCTQRQSMRLAVVASRGTDYGLEVGEPRNRFPLTAFDGTPRHGMSSDRAGAVVASPIGGRIEVCMQVSPSAFEDEYIRVFGLR